MHKVVVPECQISLWYVMCPCTWVRWLLSCLTKNVLLKFNDLRTNCHLFFDSWNLMSHACHFVHRALLAAAGSFLLSCNKTLIKIIRDDLEENKRFFHDVWVCWSFFNIYLNIKHERLFLTTFPNTPKKLQKWHLQSVFDEVQGIWKCGSTWSQMFDIIFSYSIIPGLN